MTMSAMSRTLACRQECEYRPSGTSATMRVATMMPTIQRYPAHSAPSTATSRYRASAIMAARMLPTKSAANKWRDRARSAISLRKGIDASWTVRRTRRSMRRGRAGSLTGRSFSSGPTDNTCSPGWTSAHSAPSRVSSRSGPSSVSRRLGLLGVARRAVPQGSVDGLAARQPEIEADAITIPVLGRID